MVMVMVKIAKKKESDETVEVQYLVDVSFYSW